MEHVYAHRRWRAVVVHVRKLTPHVVCSANIQLTRKFSCIHEFSVSNGTHSEARPRLEAPARSVETLGQKKGSCRKACSR
jgi:hypothetical protein